MADNVKQAGIPTGPEVPSIVEHVQERRQVPRRLVHGSLLWTMAIMALGFLTLSVTSITGTMVLPNATRKALCWSAILVTLGVTYHFRSVGAFTNDHVVLVAFTVIGGFVLGLAIGTLQISSGATS